MYAVSSDIRAKLLELPNKFQAKILAESIYYSRDMMLTRSAEPETFDMEDCVFLKNSKNTYQLKNL